MSENFNYIAFGNWEYIEGAGGDIEMSRGRMFEYTPTDIEKRVEDLSNASIAFLEQLPTFLCSEVNRAEGVVSMIVKYGRIESTTATRREVKTHFVTLIDFGEVEFESIEQAQQTFVADGFQLYRTHWAVRTGSVQQIIEKLAELKPDLAIDLPPANAATNLIEPPPRTKNIIGAADTVEAFLELLYSHAAEWPFETFFRGHEDSRFELTPSLLRKSPDGAWEFLPNEDRLCKELLIAHYEEFQADQYCFDRLVRMQHYGIPTRLLDISGNPLVALFFACHCSAEAMEIEGEVIIFRVSTENIKYFDSDTVSCIANVSNLTFEQKNDLDLSLDREAFNQTPVAKKLLHHIKSEKGFFEGRIRPEHIGSVVCAKAKRTNSRIKSQSGAFLLFGHGAALPEGGQEGIEIARITIANKQHILGQLDSININAMTVYPSIDQTADHLRERYRDVS